MRFCALWLSAAQRCAAAVDCDSVRPHVLPGQSARGRVDGRVRDMQYA